MNSASFLIVFVASCMLMFGCSMNEKKENVKAVRNLLARENSLSHRLEVAFPDTLVSIRLSMMNTEQIIKNKYVSDSINTSFAKDMNDFKINRKKIGKINKEYLMLKATLQSEKKQLNNLLEDIQNGKGNSNDHKQHLAQESLNLDTIEKGLGEFIARLKFFQSTQEQINGRVEPVAKKLLKE